MKSLVIGSIIALAASSLLAKEPRAPQELFVKKCAMCHLMERPETKEARKLMAAPAIKTVMAGSIITLDALEGPMSDEKLRETSIEFIKDYLFNPSKDKANCEDFVVRKYGVMPSMKGFVTKEEMDILIPWVYDNFKPEKTKGSYKKQN